MKYVIIVPDGMADRPLKKLKGKTPLEAARTPQMDFLAANGMCGSTNNTPKSITPASDVANMSILGIDPVQNRFGRGALEALAQGLKLGSSDIAFRMNFVEIRNGIMKDFTAGHVSNKDASELIGLLSQKMAGVSAKEFSFYTGVTYRNLMIHHDLKLSGHEYAPPHDITGKKTAPFMPKKNDPVGRIMHEAHDILAAAGHPHVTDIWLWGQGHNIHFQTFAKKYGLKCAMITAVDLLRGLGRALGFDIIKVPGITSYFDTNYANKGKYGLKALKDHDLVFIHIEAPDEAGHEGDVKEKIRAIENVDRHIVGQILQGLEGQDFKLLLLPDHSTPIVLKTHCRDDVPFVIYNSIERTLEFAPAFNERICLKPKIRFANGHELLPFFLKA
jgi:2,3-bisphosphoglycerate-independent phosphoglycerate mutase